MAIAVENLRGDQRTLEMRLWHEWLRQAGNIVERFIEEFDDDPFAYNETASVSTLVGAAHRTDMLAIADYATSKHHKVDRRRRSRGRCDLYMSCRERTWCFEFKSWIPENKIPSPGKLERLMDKAAEDARRLLIDEGDKRYGAVIVACSYLDDDLRPGCDRVLRRFADEQPLAWRLTSTDGAHLTYFFFAPAPKKRQG